MRDTTTSSTGSRSRLLVVICALFFICSCQALLINPRGHMVQEDKRISIPDSGESTGVYKNEDLVLAYKMVRTADRLNISGRIQFTRRIAENFPLVRYFHLDAILVDTQGKAQYMAGLTSVSNYYSEYITPSDPPITFNTPITVSENTKSIAFSYTGKAYDPTEDGGGGTDFWEYPFN
jgi:hypothetical protein